jgi:hypothetical protein
MPVMETGSAFAATSDRPAAALTSPIVDAGTRPGPTRPAGSPPDTPLSAVPSSSNAIAATNAVKVSCTFTIPRR